MSMLDTLVFGIRRILFGSSDIPDRDAIEFSGAVDVIDDPTRKLTRVVIGGLGATYGAQVAWGSLGTDTSAAASINYSTLLSASIGADFPGGQVLVIARANVSNASACTASFRLLLDVVSGVQPSDISLLAAESGAVTLVASLALTPGAHTIALQWMVSAGTGRCRPQTANEGAQVFCQLVGPSA